VPLVQSRKWPRTRFSSSGTAVRKAELGNGIESARQDDLDVKKVAEKQGLAPLNIRAVR